MFIYPGKLIGFCLLWKRILQTWMKYLCPVDSEENAFLAKISIFWCFLNMFWKVWIVVLPSVYAHQYVELDWDIQLIKNHYEAIFSFHYLHNFLFVDPKSFPFVHKNGNFIVNPLTRRHAQE